MTHSKNKTTGVYSVHEMKMMTFFHDLKNVIFRPLIWGLTKLGISANFLSISGGVIAFISLLLSFYLGDGLYFVIGVWTHMFFDGIDGTLARYQKTNSTFGSFVDVIFDHVGITSASIFAFYFLGMDFMATFLYTLFYTCVIFFSFILGQIKQPYKYVLRPRLILYATIAVDFIWSTNISTNTAYVLSVFLFASIVEGLIKVGKNLKAY